MNETVSRVLNELKQFPLHFEFAYAEQNSRGEDLYVFTCRELPLREFIYVPGKRGMTLGWDTKQCPLAPAILEEFRRYYEEEANWKISEILEDIAHCQKKLAGELSDLRQAGPALGEGGPNGGRGGGPALGGLSQGSAGRAGCQHLPSAHRRYPAHAGGAVGLEYAGDSGAALRPAHRGRVGVSVLRRGPHPLPLG